MDLHPNAKTTPHSRFLIARRVLYEGLDCGFGRRRRRNLTADRDQVGPAV